jgi:hypothetical protein
MRAAANGAADRVVSSRGDLDSLSNDLSVRYRFLCENAIPFKYELDCFPKIRARFAKRFALRICARQFLNETDIALGYFLEYCREPHADILAVYFP